MISRFQLALQTLFGIMLFGLLPSIVLADSWGLRTDFGVSAVDRKTGKVQWEVWRQDEIPSDLSEAGKATVERLLPDAKRSQESAGPDFPATLGKDRVVYHSIDEEAEPPHIVLAHGQPNSIGAEIARFAFDDNARWRVRLVGGRLYCLRDTELAAYDGTMKEQPKDKKWQPAWRFDLFAALPAEKRALAEFIPMDLHVNREGVWVVHGPRILQFTTEGRVKSQYTLKRTSETWFDHYVGTPLVFGDELIYFRSTSEVITIDWRKKREVWRVSTDIAPNVSAVVEIGRNLVLIQIGSDVPVTIKRALGIIEYPEPRLDVPPLRTRVAAAMLLHSYGDGFLRKKLREDVEELRKKKSDPDARQAAAIIENLLATWPRKRDQQRLIDACVTALLSAEKSGPRRVLASPATERLLTWQVAQELIYGGISPDQPFFRDSDENRLFLDGEVAARLAEHCRQIIENGPDAEKSFAASVLVSRTVGWYRLSDAERKKLFLSPQASVWPWVAMSLIRNGWRDALIQWASKRPAADQFDIVSMLANKMPKKWSKAELDFWLSTARCKPSRVAYLLRLFCEGDIPVAFRQPIRSYLEKEIADPKIKTRNDGASYLFAAVDILDFWKNPDDTPLFLKYLKHPYIRLRWEIKIIVEKRGVKPPDGIVYEEEDEQEKK